MAFLKATCPAKSKAAIKLCFAPSQSLLMCHYNRASYRLISYLGNELCHQHDGEAHGRGMAFLEFY